MEGENLPTEYDAIILGTGMTECILAAALSRVGHKVLHLDRNDYYSGDWATFHFRALREWIDARGKVNLKANPEVDPASLLEEGESLVPLEITSNTISHLVERVFVKEKNDPPVVSVAKNEETSTLECNAHEKQDSAEALVTADVENTDSKAQSDPPVLSVSKGEESAPPECYADEKQDSTEGPGTEDEETTDSKAQSDVHSVGTTTQREATDSAAKVSPCEKNDDSGTTNSTEVAHETPSPSSKNNENTSEKETEADKSWTLEELETQWRKFNIDLMPKILFCRGPMVELLISSDIAKYCEFRTITRVLTQINGQIQMVPCSRADVFSSKQVNMIEKRMMMKLLTSCMEYEKHPEDYQGFEGKPFVDYLRSKKLTKNVLHYVLNAIAMSTESTETIEGLKKTQRFLQSLGRYGNTAFLWPMYGSGELPQCFCRMCAVFGGVYCLRRTAQSAIVNCDNVVQGIVDTTGQRLKTKWLVMESSFASTQLRLTTPVQKQLSRAILLADRSIHPDSEEHITLLSLPPPDGGTGPISVLELSPVAMACPKGLFVIQMTCQSVGDAMTDLSSAIHSLYNWETDCEGTADETKPKVLWSLVFNVIDSSTDSTKEDTPQNLHILGGPSADLDLDHSIHQAKSLFESLCPGEDFLPRAPNPEDIIFDDGENNAPKDSGFTEEGLEGESTESSEGGQSVVETKNDAELHADDKEVLPPSGAGDSDVLKDSSEKVDEENKTTVQTESEGKTS